MTTAAKAKGAKAKASAKGSRIGREIIEGLKEAVAFERGEIALATRIVHVPESIDVAAIRAKTGLSQAKFAARYGLDLRALQQWEQGRRHPDRSTRILMRVIEREPEAVERALGDV